MHCSYIPFVTDFHALRQLATLKSLYRHDNNRELFRLPCAPKWQKMTDIRSPFLLNRLPNKMSGIKKTLKHETKLKVNSKQTPQLSMKSQH